MPQRRRNLPKSLESEDTPPSSFSKEEIRSLQKSTLVSFIIIRTRGKVIIVPVCVLIVLNVLIYRVFQHDAIIIPYLVSITGERKQLLPPWKDLCLSFPSVIWSQTGNRPVSFQNGLNVGWTVRPVSASHAVCVCVWGAMCSSSRSLLSQFEQFPLTNLSCAGSYDSILVSYWCLVCFLHTVQTIIVVQHLCLIWNCYLVASAVQTTSSSKHVCLYSITILVMLFTVLIKGKTLRENFS